MRLIDLDILLYAINADSPHHRSAKTWIESTIGGVETVAIPWIVILGFLRLATNDISKSSRNLQRRVRLIPARSPIYETATTPTNSRL